MEKTELYKGYALIWQEPPLTSAEWTVNVASADPRLMLKIGTSAAVISGPSREAAIASAKRYVDSL